MTRDSASIPSARSWSTSRASLDVLVALATTANLKAEHIAINWQDKPLAKAWEKVGAIMGRHRNATRPFPISPSFLRIRHQINQNRNTMIKDEFEPIPAHFFESGPYEVWSWQPMTTYAMGPYGMKKIADGLCLETALAYDWPRKEIRVAGVALTDAELADLKAELRKRKEVGK